MGGGGGGGNQRATEGKCRGLGTRGGGEGFEGRMRGIGRLNGGGRGFKMGFPGRVEDGIGIADGEGRGVGEKWREFWRRNCQRRWMGRKKCRNEGARIPAMELGERQGFKTGLLITCILYMNLHDYACK